PPPPPGIPPPPPPPPPGGGNPSHGHRKKKRVRSFFWKTIPEEKVRAKPNIWTLATRQQQQYQIDVRTIEELFGQHEEARSAGGLSRGDRSRGSLKETKKEICILDSKRGMNVGIFLKQFRKSNQAIIEDIHFGKSAPFGSEPLKELLKLLPESDELKKLRAFKGDADRLSLADSFMYLLIQVPSFELRLEAMVLKEEFAPLCSAMSNEIDIMRTATKELMSCEELHAILHLVLQAGNIMNAGGYAGNAVGFKLSSLLSLADTKANKPGMNLLHFVALEAQKKDEHLLKFPEKLVHVQSAARMSLENVEAEFQSLHRRTQSVEAKVLKDAGLQQQLDEFLQSWSRALQDLKKRRTDLRQEGNALIDFFCEDKDTFKLDDCFRIFQDFCLKFKKAVQDNWERELKEVAKQRRLRELEEKRHSWAGNGDQGGGFGRSSSENDVETLTREGLLDFLQQRPRSPNSPLGRSSSARRYRSAASAADRDLRSFLELTASTDDNANANANGRLLSPSRPGRSPVRGTAGGVVQWSEGAQPGDLGSPPEASEGLPTFRVSPSAEADPHLDDNRRSAFSRPTFLIGADPETNVFQKAAGSGRGQMSISVERHTLVPRLQPFDFVPPGSGGDDNGNVRLADRGDVVITDLEILDTPASSTSSGPSRGSIAGRDDKTDSSTGPEQEENSTDSSVTHNPPPALEPSVSNKQPIPHFLDSTDTDCSVILDYSETDSPVSRAGKASEMRTQVNDSRGNVQHSLSMSTNEPSVSASTNETSVSASTNEPSMSASTNEQSMSASTNEKAASPPTNDPAVSPSTNEHSASASTSKPSVISSTKEKPAPTSASSSTIDQPASPSANKHSASTFTNDQTDPQSGSNTPESVPLSSRDDTTKRKEVDEKPVDGKAAASTKTVSSKSKPASKNPVNSTKIRSVRTLTTSENQSMRKVVPISKVNRLGGVAGRSERAVGQENTRRSLQDHSAPSRRTEPQRGLSRRTSLPPEYPKTQKTPQPGALSRGPSFKKPATKPVRTVPKPPPEEKMCRSTMRALGLAQGSGSAPPTPAHSSKSPLPGFARNTVASSSRRMKKDASPSSTPSTPSKSSTLTRTGSLRRGPNRVAPAGRHFVPGSGEEKTLPRSPSLRGHSRVVHPNATPPSPRGHSHKFSSNLSDKSVHSKDSASSNTLKPTWK
ncbi:FH2 domain-containing protein 1-like, partial [Conger conger]|uniref:FH2 domain-containing protein 1-like n=1 Tax=Conger conger TaxID=82655 RepID=UPI002A5ADF39